MIPDHHSIDPASNQPHLAGFDGIRAIGIMGVILGHIALWSRWNFGLMWGPGAYSLLSFFVLSGFLITFLLLGEHERSGSMSLRRFMIRRALKILPPLYLFWLVAVGIPLLGHRPVPWGFAWSTFFYYSDYYLAFHPELNSFSHTWSLGVEEQFYLLWPLLLSVLVNRPKLLTRVLLSILGLLWVWRVLLVFVIKADTFYRYFAFDARADAIFVGCLAAVLLRQGRLDGLIRRATANPLLPAATLTAMAFVALLQFKYGDYWRDTAGYPLFALLMALLLLQLTRVGKTSWRWLEWPWFRYLGKVSYSLYLWQQLTIPIAMEVLSSARRAIQMPVALGFTLLVGMCAYHLLEAPALRLKARYGYRS